MGKGPENLGPDAEPESDENLSPAEKLRRQLNESERNETDIFQAFLAHSRDYQEALGLSNDQVQRMERENTLTRYPSLKDFMGVAKVHVTVDGIDFAIVAKHTCCHDYGKFSVSEGWRDLLMAISADEELNKSAGRGTSLINVIPKVWHSRLLAFLKGESGDETPKDFQDFKPEDIIGPQGQE
jgi:hypothetical protein